MIFLNIKQYNGITFVYLYRMKKTLFLLFGIAFLVTSFSLVHKFYLSVTNINYVEKSDALQITSRIFTDDLEDLLEERYDLVSNLGTDKESPLADSYIQKYLKSKFVLKLNEEVAPYTYIGKKYDNDVVIIYLEISEVGFDNLNSISVVNDVLTDLYDEQKNMVHIKWKGQKKSFVLIRETNKGMLNL